MTDLKALALYTNEAEDNDELSFKTNDLLLVVQENWQEGWHLCQVCNSRIMVEHLKGYSMGVQEKTI